MKIEVDVLVPLEKYMTRSLAAQVVANGCEPTRMDFADFDLIQRLARLRRCFLAFNIRGLFAAAKLCKTTARDEFQQRPAEQYRSLVNVGISQSLAPAFVGNAVPTHDVIEKSPFVGNVKRNRRVCRVVSVVIRQ